MKDATHAGLRVAIIGSCQVVGLAAAAESLLPGADVRFWHVGVYPKHTDEELLEHLAGFDVVISQLSDWDDHVPLRISRLRKRGLPVVHLPVVVFPGFHPDITYLRGPDALLPGPSSDYHSVIVASAYAMGLPEARVPALFNAFVFAELGYFEVFEAAKQALFTSFDQEGFDLRQLFEQWIKQVGQFMYTLNHPHIFVLASLCRLALVRSGRLDATIPLPEAIDDDLAGHFIWPTYPALARPIGIVGSTTFLRGIHGSPEGQPREFSLNDYISAAFRLYDGLSRDSLRTGDVASACDRLRGIVVS